MFCLIPPSLTAFAPEHAQMAANFVKPLDDEGRVFCHERALSKAELTELAGYTPRFDVAEITLLIMLLATAVAGVWLAVSAHPLHLGWSIAAVAGIAWRGRTLLPFLRRRFLITRDIHDARVMIVRFRRGEDVDEQTLSPAYEVLPNSRLEWSEAGMPSRWRKILGGGRTLHFRLGPG
jgi:hypothetical protein